MPQLMKGHKWRDRKHTMTYPAWVEVKRDEIRCHVIVCPQTWIVAFISYAEKPLFNLGPWAKQWVELARNTGLFEFDTGVEVNGNYADTYRYVRSKSGVPEELKNAKVQFILFDLPTLTSSFQNRCGDRHNVWALGVGQGFEELVIPHGEWAQDEEQVDALYYKYRAAGLEGAMVKSLEHLYERGKRVVGWLKLKPTEDADGVIKDLIRAESIHGVPLDRIGSVRIVLEDGSEATPHGVPHALGADMFNSPDKYIGQWAEFHYMERDRKEGYRHPTWGRLREDKV